MESFIAVFREKINKEDVYEFVYVPGAGTKISKNGKLKTTIQGIDFKKALFGIWLCAKPAQESLKDADAGEVRDNSGFVGFALQPCIFREYLFYAGRVEARNTTVFPGLTQPTKLKQKAHMFGE